MRFDSRSRMNGRTTGNPPTKIKPRISCGHAAHAWSAMIVPIE
jgi:hypothetical protein